MKEELEVKVEGKEWKDLVDASFNEVVKDVRIDGFRKGKVPKNVYEKKFGRSELIYEAANKVLQDKYRELVLDSNVDPLLEPKINVIKMDEDSFIANIVIITEPKAILGEYKGLKVKKGTAKVSKEEIQERIASLLQEYAEITVKDGGMVENGDIAIIDFEGFKDGVPFAGGKSENYSLTIGSHTFIPGFEEGIIGMKKGEEKELKLTFPADYASPELKGKDVIFKVKVNEIKTRVVPEINEEFFADLGMDNIKTKEDLEKSIKEEILEEKNHQLEHKFEDDLLEAACGNMKIDLASELVDDEKEHMYEDLLKNLQMQGVNEEVYLKYTNSTKEDIISKMTEEATRRLKYRYLMKEIIKSENIKVSDEEVDKRIAELAKNYKMTEEEVRKEIGNMEYIRADLAFQKALDVLIENN